MSPLLKLAVVTIAMLASAAVSIRSKPYATAQPTPDDAALIVYGATPAGIAAAITAARERVRVLLLEPTQHVGGMATGGLSRSDLGVRAVIGGFAAEFFRRLGEHYGEPSTWYFEPKVASDVFDRLLRYAGVEVLKGHRLREKRGVRKNGQQIESITLENGKTLRARVFIDATYEGDLMAQSAVSFTWGREGTSDFGESLAGVRAYTPSHQFVVQLNPFDARKRLLPEVSASPRGEPGQADRKVQAYNFRLCMTSRPTNRTPVPRPPGYDARRYALLGNMLAEVDRVKRGTATLPLKVAQGPERLCCLKKEPWAFNDVVSIGITKNDKADINNYGAFSTDYIGGNYEYPNGTYAVRARIVDEHVRYTKGFFYFINNDPSVPSALREAAASWGLCKDEFVATGHWPPQLYIREARRMRGPFVMTQKDIQTDVVKSDSIGMGSYNSDSHNVQRIVARDGTVENEGDMQVRVTPYQIPYRVMLPKPSEATNLLVPVSVSATHVAFSTLRMEPQFMIIGQAAGVAASLAIAAGSTVQAIDTRALSDKLRAHGAVLEFTASDSQSK